MSKPGFDAATLIAEARESTGLGDLGPDDFRPGLDALVATYTGGRFTERGTRRNRRRLGQLLATRLRVEDALGRHPEIRERPLPRPLVLTGLPRSGTSALFNLLAADAAARPLRLWETQFPDPAEGFAPGASDAGPDPRHEAVKAYYDGLREKNPEFTKMHYTDADTPEECVLLHAYAFSGVQMGIEVMLEPYASWYREQDLRPMYRCYRDLLRLLDWQRPGERWLLKAPAHMWGIEALIETFPDVGIVWSHRDPLACTASVCSLTQMLMADQVEMDPHELGPIVMDFYATSLERGLAARDRCDPARFVDVGHDDFVAEPGRLVEDVYRHFELPLGPAARDAMAAHIRDNPKGKHGTHEYGLAEFGLREADVRERFADYTRRFGLGP